MYLGKKWLKDPLPMSEVVKRMGLGNAAQFPTEDVAGTYNWRGEDILILIHLSWGELDAVEKVRLYAHHVNEEDEGALYEELTRNL